MITKQQEKSLLKKIEKVENKIKILQLPDKQQRAKIIKRNKKVKWPETIDILEYIWHIEMSEDLHNKEGKKVKGLCYTPKRRIFIDLASEDIVKVILHELIHSIDYEFGRVFDGMRVIRANKIFNEFRVDTLAQIWLDIFKQLKGIELKNEISR